MIRKEYSHYIELCDQDSIKYCYMCCAVELSSGIPTQPIRVVHTECQVMPYKLTIVFALIPTDGNLTNNPALYMISRTG